MSSSNGSTNGPLTINEQKQEQHLERMEALVGNISLRGQEFARQILDYQNNRDIYEICKYPRNPSAEEYQRMFEREPLAARVVEVMAKEAWRTTPDVWEDDNSEVSTKFEKAWDELGRILKNGEESLYEEEEGNPIWEYLLRAEILAGIGSYGVIFLGIDDGQDPSMPVAGVVEEGSAPMTQDQLKKQQAEQGNRTVINKKGSTRKPYSLTLNAEIQKEAGTKLSFIRVFPEAQAPITAKESNTASPRYGQPTEYLITLEGGTLPTETSLSTMTSLGTVRVHWTRIIHIKSDGPSSSQIYGIPRMQQVLNNLLGIQKLSCASPEAFWKGCMNLLVFETIPQLIQAGMKKDQIDKEGLRTMMANVEGGFEKFISLFGLQAKSIAPTVTDPTPHYNIQVEQICIQKGIPIPVFKGYEIGEQASTNNDADWKDRLKHHRRIYSIPIVVVPTVNRLIMTGCLPKPTKFKLGWGDVEAQSQVDRMTVAAQAVTMFAQYIQGGVSQIFTFKDLLTRYLGFTNDEADAIIEAAVGEYAQQQEDDMQQQEEAIARGIAPDPTGGALGPTPADVPEAEVVPSEGQ